VGQEVLVEYLSGNPDLPMVAGRVYTNLQRVPYPLPENASVTVIAKTNSLGGSGGFNEIKADDRAGAELLYVRAERDLETLVQHHERRTVGVERHTVVGKHDTLEVAENKNVTVGGAETRTFTSPKPGAPRTTQTNRNGFKETMVGPSLVTVTPSEIFANASRIVLTTGGATITLEGGNIAVDATTVTVTSDLIKMIAKVIDMVGSSEVNVVGGVVDVKGQPIQLNC
jgi:type VI secretion system secreted protein VgrG